MPRPGLSFRGMFKTFHYGVCYYPEAWDPKRHPRDIERIARAGFNFVRMGESAWSYWEPREGRFQFELFDRVIDLCRKHDIQVVMGTPTYTGPAWISHNYPEVLRWNFERIPMRHGSRRNFNYTSPKYLELSDRLCTALAKHYKSERQIFAWQLDNEFNCHMDVSYAPSDTIAFRAWVKDKYKSLEKLNKAWGTAFWSQTYSDWAQIDLPHPSATYLNPSLLLDESRFISDCVVKFASRQAEILRKHNPKWLITHNALFGNINGPDLVKPLDFFGHDQYPLFDADWCGPASHLIQARSLSFPYGVLEQQAGPGGQMSYLQRTPRPGEMRRWAWQSIFHGAKLLSYFRWRTCPYGSEQHWHGLIDADDRDTRRLVEAAQIGKEIRAIPQEFFDAPIKRNVGVIRDFENDVNDLRINTYARHGHGEARRWIAELSRRHVPVDRLWPESDFRGYEAIIAPHVKIIDQALVKKLERFVQAGGTMVITAQSGSKDCNCHMVEQPLPGLLSKLAGTEIEDWTTLSDKESRQVRLGNGRSMALDTFVERLKPIKAETIARWMTDDPLLADSPAIVRNRVGKGTVYYIGGYLPTDAVNVFLGTLKLKPTVHAGPDVEAIPRGPFVALINHATSAQRVSGLNGRDVLGNQPIVGGSLLLPPNGVAIVET